MSKHLLPGLGLALAVAVAACGGTAVAATKATPSPGRVRNGAAGQLVKISGQTLTLSGASGDVTVVYTSATRIQQTSTGSLADIVPGVCLVAGGQKDSGGTLTAYMVRISSPTGGACTVGFGAGGGFGGGRPGGGSFGGGFRPGEATPPANAGFAAGLVTAVSGTSVTIKPTGLGAASLTVPTTVRVMKIQAATAADLQIDQCLVAAGPRDASGTVHAVALTITPPGPTGTCSLRRGFFNGGGAAGG